MKFKALAAPATVSEELAHKDREVSLKRAISHWNFFLGRHGQTLSTVLRN